MVAGGVRQYSAAAVAPGPAVHRPSAELPDTPAQKDVLHSHRVHMTDLSKPVSPRADGCSTEPIKVSIMRR